MYRCGCGSEEYRILHQKVESYDQTFAVREVTAKCSKCGSERVLALPSANTTPGNIVSGFCGPHIFLSNFYPCSVLFEGILYPSSEHAYQASKTRDITLRKQIAGVRSATDAKWMGRRLILAPDFEERKLDCMLAILWEKFRNIYLRKALLGTGTRVLLEGNDWGDTFWGVVTHKGVLYGSNWLGRHLMTVRKHIELGQVTAPTMAPVLP